jgi:hypothetical protein
MKKFLVFVSIILSIALTSMISKKFTVDEELLRISNEYRTYQLYDSQAHWTYSYCEPMTTPYKGDTLHMSFADPKKSPHGNSLYKLYVKDEKAYATHGAVQPEGQVLIKEVWNVRMLSYENDTVKNKTAWNRDTTITVPVYLNPNDHQYYTPTTRKQLFIMYKVKPSKENDEGWWYGIVDIEQGVEKSSVIESMKINRCVKCHAVNKYDRIFGDPR